MTQLNNINSACTSENILIMISKFTLILFVFAVFALAMENPHHPPGEAATRAQSLVGKSRSEYVCNQVVNYAYYDAKDYKGYLANTYKGFGSASNTFKPGCAVVAQDGSHVGIVSNDNMLIHSSSSKYMVIKVPLSQVPYVFPSGHLIRCY